MGSTQVAAIIFAMISLTFGGKEMVSEPVYNVPYQQPVEIHMFLENAEALPQDTKVLREVVIKQAPPMTIDPPKRNLATPALLITLALLVFGGNGT